MCVLIVIRSIAPKNIPVSENCHNNETGYSQIIIIIIIIYSTIINHNSIFIIILTRLSRAPGSSARIIKGNNSERIVKQLSIVVYSLVQISIQFLRFVHRAD